MLLDKKLIGLAKVAAQDESRPVLTCIKLEKGWATATDGFKALEIELPKWEGYENELPENGYKPIIGEEKHLIPAKELEKALNAIPAKNNLPILNNAWTSAGRLELDRKTVKIVSTDLANVNAPEITEIEGNFPELEKVYPDGDPKARTHFDAKKMIELLQAILKATNEDKHSSNIVTLEIFEELKAIKLTARTGDRQIKGLLMPVRT